MSFKIYTLLPEMSGLRLDKAISFFEDIKTRSRAEYLIDHDLVKVNGKIQKSSYKVQEKDLLEISIPEKKSSPLSSLNFELDILFEDDDLIVVNKPAGMVVHPSAGHEHDTLVNALLGHTKNLSMKFNEERPGIVHRIDRDTSGLLVIAKNDFAHEFLAKQFKDKTTHRIYYAACIGELPKSKGTIENFIARHPGDRKKFKTFKDQQDGVGKWAITHYETLKRNHGLSYLKLKLETGRTHQIRVHLSDLGYPIIADLLYSSDRKMKSIKSTHTRELVASFPRFALHAAELGFTHPTTKEQMNFKVDWPQDLTPLLKKLDFL